ncbi:MAG: protein kinase [Acidobacteriota bacterium]|jgi:Tol biopolymer transport system component
MALSPGTRLGPYELRGPLGAGGMGEVYRARDTRLDRDVAVKVLPRHLAASPDALARFQAEAKAVAALSHPNILALHDIGTEDDTTYAVTELLEGETLRKLLEGGPLPPRKAVEYAVQVASGLSAAHGKGIVHRDLKPENLFLTTDGRIKILDFGLARMERGGDGDATHTPTMTQLTEPGTVMGSVGYMSPEQVRGETADARSDLFALGTVLHEMLSGNRAFVRETAAETMTAILREDPAPLPESVPSALGRVVHRCLEKRPQDRFQSAQDLAFTVDNALGASTGVQPVARETLAVPGRAPRLALTLGLPAVLLFGLATGIGIGRFWSVPPPTRPVEVRTLTFSGKDGEPAASPDGRMIAFRSTRDGRSRIWLKQIAGGAEVPLTEGQDSVPRFSPGGSAVLFVRSEGGTPGIYRVPILGGEPRKILDNAFEFSSSPDGEQLAFVRRSVDEGGRVNRVLIADRHGVGEREVLTSDSRNFFAPRWSPDGGQVAVLRTTVLGNRRDMSLTVIDLATLEARVVRTAGHVGPLSSFAWIGGGREIVIAQSLSLLGDQTGAVSRVFRWDLENGVETELFREPDLFPMRGGTYDVATFDILAPGTLTFGATSIRQNLLEIPLRGGGGASPLTRGNSRDRQPTYAPDGRVLFTSNRSGNLDLWVLDRATGAVRQLTDDPAQDWDPAFTPDGSNVLWSSDRSGHLEIWIAAADGSGARQLTRDGEDAENPTATPDGEWILYWTGNPDRLGLWKIRPDGSEDTALVRGTYGNTEVSPDGRHVAFLRLDRTRQSNTIFVATVEDGEILPFQIDVPYPAGGGVVWGRCRWLPDGSGIAYLGQDEQGRSGVFAQDFVPGRDTSPTRRPLAGFTDEYGVESFGISPDGSRITLTILEETSNIRIAEGVPGVTRPEGD